MSTASSVVLYDTAMWPDLMNQDPSAQRLKFAKRFARAETIDDLFGVLEGNNSQALVGHTVKITGVEWQPYESDEGIIPNGIIEAVDTATGEVIEFATTSEMVTLFIRRAELLGLIRFTAKITQKKTKAGNQALNLERAS